MKSFYYLIGSIIFSIGTPLYSQSEITNFPYVNSLKGTSAPNHITGIGPHQSFTNDGILLTPAETSRRGAVVLDGVTFNSTNGVIIEFEYDMYNGTTFEGKYGDGLSFFLYDGSTTTTDLLGSLGAAVGYSYNRSSSSSTRSPGLNNAYIGISLDQFGNFKSRRFQGDSYVSGLNTVDWGSNGASHVTIRGAMSNNAISNISSVADENSNKRYAGYPVLYTQSTLQSTSTNSVMGAYLNMINNSATNVEYTIDNKLLTNYFSLRGGVANPAVGSTGYRKAILELQPANPSSGGGFLVTLKIVHGGTTTTVIDNYHYRNSFYFRENANRNSSNASTTTTNHLLNATPPVQMKIGFGAATGSSSQAHLIKNLKISLPYQPIFQADSCLMCTTMTRNVKINIFENDVMYNGNLYDEPIGGSSNTYIAYDTFRFQNSSGTVLGTTNATGAQYVQPNVGTWSYLASTGQVTFTPLPNFRGNASVFYSAKGTASLGGPFSQEIYRSTSTQITVKVDNCNSTINPQLPGGGVKRSGF